MEEAKNMLRIGTYHAHIVNLQGVICEVEKEGQRLSNVSNILLVFEGCLMLKSKYIEIISVITINSFSGLPYSWILFKGRFKNFFDWKSKRYRKAFKWILQNRKYFSFWNEKLKKADWLLFRCFNALSLGVSGRK